MSGNVIPLTSRRKNSFSHEGLVYCPCGDAWWNLIEGGVNIAPDGTVVGWSGNPTCCSCGRPMGNVSA